ncbi:CpaF family protein [Endozoicomonas acroporae]|uniref:CpaF family protein n=1 Tax=Endozoicomonas acroporae TaxID=1701104 RepID=UPI003D7A1FFF
MAFTYHPEPTVERKAEKKRREPVISDTDAAPVIKETSEEDSLQARRLRELQNHWQQRVHEELLERLDLPRLSKLPHDQARRQIEETGQQLLTAMSAPLSMEQRSVILSEIIDELLGLGPLEKLLRSEDVSDILVNGAETIYMEKQGKLTLTGLSFRSNEHLLNVIEKIVAQVGRRIDESSPMVDARLPDGSRVNAIIPPLALDGPSLSIRRATVDRMSLLHLAELGAMAPQMARTLEAMVRMRLNILVSGGTGTGKTTLLNALSGCIPEDDRIITIEDSAELQLQQPHVVRLETRPANLEGKGEINQRELVKNSLRMRPDRIVVGEVRGAEALDMLSAMNTGHDGSLTTIHANTPRDALQRLDNMVQMTGLAFSQQSLRQQIASAIDLVVQLERMEDGKRRIVSIQEVNGMEQDIITMTEIFRFQRRGHDESGQVTGVYKATGLVPELYHRLALYGIELSRDVFDTEWQYGPSGEQGVAP